MVASVFMKIERATFCSQRWRALGHHEDDDEAERRAAINRLYYAAFTACRVRFGFNLTRGDGQHRKIPEKIRRFSEKSAFTEDEISLADHFEELRELRGDSDYQFHKHIDEDDYKNAVKLADIILTEIQHARWDGADRVDNPPEDSAEDFFVTLHNLRDAFKAAVHRFDNEIPQKGAHRSHDRFSVLFGAVKQSYVRFWCAALNFVQSDDAKHSGIDRALYELQSASEVYFAANDVFMHFASSAGRSATPVLYDENP